MSDNLPSFIRKLQRGLIRVETNAEFFKSEYETHRKANPDFAAVYMMQLGFEVERARLFKEYIKKAEDLQKRCANLQAKRKQLPGGAD